MKKISVGTKMIIDDREYIVKEYEDKNGKYYVVEPIYGGNLNGVFRNIDELIDELTYSIGIRAIRSAFLKQEFNFKII